VSQARLTVAEAAWFFGVRPATVRTWVRRYQLVAAGKRGNAHVYPFAELASAERRARLYHNAPRFRD